MLDCVERVENVGRCSIDGESKKQLSEDIDLIYTQAQVCDIHVSYIAVHLSCRCMPEKQ